MRTRIEQELALLRQHYDKVEHTEVAGEDWFRLACYRVPLGWRIAESAVVDVPIVFLVNAGYPGATPPYGFLAPAGLNFNGAAPGNAGGPPKAPPFAGDWMHFSWTVDNWSATADISKGSNLLSWTRGFAQRFREGA